MKIADPPFIPREDADYTLETVEDSIDPKSGFRYLRAFLAFDDWLNRRCKAYVEALIPEGASIPGVIHCPGGGQTIDYQDLRFWADQGYASASFDWQIEAAGRPPDRTSIWPEEVNAQSLPHDGVENCIMPIAIEAGRSTLTWLADFDTVDPERLGVGGISWGGYMTWLIGAHDSRPKALMPVYGSGVFGQIGPAHSRDNPPQLDLLWKNNWDPQALAPKQHAPACYLSASNDFFGNLEEADELLSKIKVPTRASYLPNCDHSLGPTEGALAAAWMNHYLKDGPEVAESPTLRDDLTIETDQSEEIERTEIWWTACDCAPRFACWHSTPSSPEPSEWLLLKYIIAPDTAYAAPAKDHKLRPARNLRNLA